MSIDLNFYKGKKVLLTGHTGFKGSWLSVMLVNAGAEVIGFSSCSNPETRLFDICGVKDQIVHIKGDVRDLEHLLAVFQKYQPQFNSLESLVRSVLLAKFCRLSLCLAFRDCSSRVCLR